MCSNPKKNVNEPFVCVGCTYMCRLPCDRTAARHAIIYCGVLDMVVEDGKWLGWIELHTVDDR